MHLLRLLHLYLGCLFAPALLFFAVTGSWQLFNWHQSDKEPGGYQAPSALHALSYIHKEAHLPPTPGRQRTPLRYFLAAAALGLVISTLLGVTMAYRFSRRPIIATLLLLIGTILPATLLWIYR